MKIGIIIVNYNGKHLLEKNLQSVVDTEYEDFEIIGYKSSPTIKLQLSN